MAARDLGTKFTCFKCGTKFYDLKKPEPICPKCGADQRESPVLQPPDKTERKRAARALLEQPMLEDEVFEDEEEVADEEEETGTLPEDDDEDY